MLLVGAAIKLMDDHLDAEYDICRGERTLAVRLGRACLPYALVLALLAAYIDRQLTLALFFSSYAVGMLSQWRDVLPTRLPAVCEMAAAVCLSCTLTGWRTALWALALMVTIDWLDDLADVHKDVRTGQRNVAARLGVVETSLLVLAAMCLAVLASPRLTAIAFVVLTLLTIAAEWTTRRLWQGETSPLEMDW
ncbi:MAG: hypothetical protein K6T31_05790 [Alicyclobacillus sp.]|nr:hypothetical protein [Alicyclobacillus sp.]